MMFRDMPWERPDQTVQERVGQEGEEWPCGVPGLPPTSQVIVEAMLRHCGASSFSVLAVHP